MELLERYLRQIKRYLPIRDRDETINELRSLIMDQVDELVSQGQNESDALHDVIVEMGHPYDVAERYNERGPIISKQMEPIMKLVMKITAITLPLVILFADSIDFVTSQADFTFTEFLLNIAYMIPSAIYSLVIAIGMIFIIFALIERYLAPKFSVEEKPFNPDLLPEIPKKALKVSTLGSVLTIFITVAALYVVNFQPGLIGVYYDGDRLPLLNDRFDQIVPFINISWFVSILLHIYYLYKQTKNIPTKTLEMILGIYGGIIAIFLGTSNIFNDVIIEGYDLNIVPTIIKYVLIFVGVASIIGSIVDYVKLFLNLDQLEQIQKK